MAPISRGIVPGARALCAPLMLVTLSHSVPADVLPEWRDTFTTRVEALALIQTLNADLLSHDSATTTLEGWCAAHRLAAPATIVAERMGGPDKPALAETRAVLSVGDAETVRYRHVRLRCGAAVLSEADNWYVPSRLTAEMNAVLEGTDTPFGRAVQALRFRRHTLSARLLWSPLPEGWEMGAKIMIGPANMVGPGKLSIPAAILEHRAILSLPDGTPFSALVETYTGAVLGFPARTAP